MRLERKLLYVKAGMLVTLGDGRRAFLKLYHSSVRKRRRQSGGLVDRERVCLRVLAGLAVPKLIEIDRADLERFAGFASSTASVAQSFVRGRHLDQAGFDPSELLGAWLFLTEHLVAFRRHQILYTDLKAANVLATRRPLRVTQIDFNYAAAASPSGVYPSHCFGYTRGFQAPEHGSTPRLSEAALVYQLGMLLAHCRLGVDNASLRRPRRGLDRLLGDLERMGAPDLARLAHDCLAERPGARPRSYEEVLERAKLAAAHGKPARALRVWRALRDPYAARLADVGLEGPEERDVT